MIVKHRISILMESADIQVELQKTIKNCVGGVFLYCNYSQGYIQIDEIKNGTAYGGKSIFNYFGLIKTSGFENIIETNIMSPRSISQLNIRLLSLDGLNIMASDFMIELELWEEVI